MWDNIRYIAGMISVEAVRKETTEERLRLFRPVLETRLAVVGDTPVQGWDNKYEKPSKQ